MARSGAITPLVTTRKPPSLNAEPTSRKTKPLTGKDRSHLRAIGHSLDAVVHIGKTGISRGLLDEVARALEAHELIKVRLIRECPLEREVVAEQLSAGCGAEHIQTVGGVLLFYRARPKKPIIELPGAPPTPTKTGGKSKAKPQIHHAKKQHATSGKGRAAPRRPTNKGTRPSKSKGERAPARRRSE